MLAARRRSPPSPVHQCLRGVRPTVKSVPGPRKRIASKRARRVAAARSRARRCAAATPRPDRARRAVSRSRRPPRAARRRARRTRPRPALVRVGDDRPVDRRLLTAQVALACAPSSGSCRPGSPSRSAKSSGSGSPATGSGRPCAPRGSRSARGSRGASSRGSPRAHSRSWRGGRASRCNRRRRSGRPLVGVRAISRMRGAFSGGAVEPELWPGPTLAPTSTARRAYFSSRSSGVTSANPTASLLRLAGMGAATADTTARAVGAAPAATSTRPGR